MRNLIHFFVRSSTFFIKELLEVLRQPRLILNLVLGPFLIMLLFGIGFSNKARQVKTVFVVQNDKALIQDINTFTQQLGDTIINEGITTDKENALKRLARNEVELVIVSPENPLETMQNNKQAVFYIYHNEIDPAQVGYVDYIGRLYVNSLNKSFLKSVTIQGQGEASSLQPTLKKAQAGADALQQSVINGDFASIRNEKQKLSHNLQLIKSLGQPGLMVIHNIRQTFGGQSEEILNKPENELDTLLNEIDQSLAMISATGDLNQNSDQQKQQAEKVKSQIESLDELLTKFQSITPDVLISPFKSETASITGAKLKSVDFYTPAVIALLIQHLSVTFAALSIVRERRSGAFELFRASPISSIETLLGKYLSYFLFIAFLMAMLSFLVIKILGAPMLGNWWDYSSIIIVMVFTSLGAGFLISMISKTDTQAVQNSMLLLLASIFFSGFLMDLRLMIDPYRAISWLLPATYGINMLKDVMLRGQGFSYGLMIAISGIGVGLFIVNWILMRRLMKTK